MTDTVTIAARLYDAMAARDASALLEAMTVDFVGRASAGMPLGVGGRHNGRDAMLRDVWMPVFSAYDMNVDVESFLPSGEDTVVALGFYRGIERGTGRRMEARFVHILDVDGDRVAGLEQVTDTRCWDATLRRAA